jgi:hypothetical protein
LRTFVVNGSNHRDHTVATHALHDHLRRRNANARHAGLEHGSPWFARPHAPERAFTTSA